MNSMKKGLNTFFVSLVAIILAMPLAGVTSSFTFSESQFSSNENFDISRSSYAVDIDYTCLLYTSPSPRDRG